MSRAPLLNNLVVLSIEALLEDLKPADYLGTDKEAGVKYITALVKHYRDPGITAKRQAAVERTRQYTKER